MNGTDLIHPTICKVIFVSTLYEYLEPTAFDTPPKKKHFLI